MGSGQGDMAMSIKNGRSGAGGQAIVEGTCMLVVICMVMVALFIMIIDAYAICNYSFKAQMVAIEAAKVINANKYWLGLPRADYNPDAAKHNAAAVANSLCDTLGLPQIQDADFAVLNDTNENADAITVKLTLRHCPIPYINFDIPINAIGVCLEPQVTPYGITQIGVPVPGAPDQYQIATLPAYGFCQGTKTPAGGYTNVIGFMGGGAEGIGMSNALSPERYDWFVGLPLQNQQFHQALLSGTKATK